MSIRILAFNTVTELCSVALMINHKIYDRRLLAPSLHAENILSMINQLLIDTGVELKSLDCIVLDQGPGSFMGIRLGLSIAQGLALGANLPLITVSSLEILAQGAWRIFSSKQVITVIDARMQKLYWARFSRVIDGIKNNLWISINRACLITNETAKNMICKLIGKWSLVGTGWNTDHQLVSHINTKIDTIIAKKIMLPDAQDMLPLGAHLYKKNAFLDLNKIRLTYLSDNIIKKKSFTIK